jgi:hypothetical protein
MVLKLKVSLTNWRLDLITQLVPMKALEFPEARKPIGVNQKAALMTKPRILMLDSGRTRPLYHFHWLRQEA